MLFCENYSSMKISKTAKTFLTLVEFWTFGQICVLCIKRSADTPTQLIKLKTYTDNITYDTNAQTRQKLRKDLQSRWKNNRHN